MLEHQYTITILQWKEGMSALQVSDTRERDLKDPRGHPGGGFRPRRAGEQGADCRPLHPRLASLCSAFKTASAAWSRRHARLLRGGRQQHRPTRTVSSTTLIDKEKLPRRDCGSL